MSFFSPHIKIEDQRKLFAQQPEEILRSPREGSNWHPNWRHEIAMSAAVRDYNASQKGLPWRRIEDEDKMVNFLYDFYLHRIEDRHYIKWAHGVVNHNSTQGDSSRIKALLISGMSSAEIASEMHVPTAYIQAFLYCYFDMERYLDEEMLVSKIVHPFAAGDYDRLDEEHRRERLWIYAGYLLGTKDLKKIMNRTFNVDGSDADSMLKLSLGLLSMQSATYALSLPTRGDVRPADMEKFVSLQGMQNLKEQESQESNFVKNQEANKSILSGYLATLKQKQTNGEMTAKGEEKLNLHLELANRQLGNKTTKTIEVAAIIQEDDFSSLKIDFPKQAGRK